MDAATLAAQGLLNAALNRLTRDDDDDGAEEGDLMACDDDDAGGRLGDDDDLLPTQSDVGVRTRRRRTTIEWDLIGTYRTEEEMMAERWLRRFSFNLCFDC